MGGLSAVVASCVNALQGNPMSTKQVAKQRTSEVAIFSRLIKTEEGNLSRELAHYLLTLGFGEEDQARMSELAERNQEGILSSTEQEELRNYVQAGHLLARLHSKARKSIEQKKVS